MANPYFSFKKFTVYQDQCAMKVCTDSCILGAWFAAKIPSYSLVLDIGAGTGLLMLMLAQKNKAEIHGIELDIRAFKQLKENIANSEWKQRLTVFPGDIRSWSFTDQYDFIITNPPFFEDDLTSTSSEKNMAMHSSALKLEELMQAIIKNLQPTGSFGILLPYHRAAHFEQLAFQNNFHLVEKINIRQTAVHDYFRTIFHFSRNQQKLSASFELNIKQEDGSYSEDFVELLKDYYLYL